MEPDADEARKAIKSYRLILIGAVIVIGLLTFWLAKPGRPLDFRFMSALSPKVKLDANYLQATVSFTQDTATVKALLDSHLLNRGGWRSGGGPATLPIYLRNVPSFPFAEGNADMISMAPDGKGGTLVMITSHQIKSALLP